MVRFLRTRFHTFVFVFLLLCRMFSVRFVVEMVRQRYKSIQTYLLIYMLRMAPEYSSVKRATLDRYYRHASAN